MLIQLLLSIAFASGILTLIVRSTRFPPPAAAVDQEEPEPAAGIAEEITSAARAVPRVPAATSLDDAADLRELQAWREDSTLFWLQPDRWQNVPADPSGRPTEPFWMHLTKPAEPAELDSMITSCGTAAGICGQGAFATLSQSPIPYTYGRRPVLGYTLEELRAGLARAATVSTAYGANVDPDQLEERGS